MDQRTILISANCRAKLLERTGTSRTATCAALDRCHCYEGIFCLFAHTYDGMKVQYATKYKINIGSNFDVDI